MKIYFFKLEHPRLLLGLTCAAIIVLCYVCWVQGEFISRVQTILEWVLARFDLRIV